MLKVFQSESIFQYKYIKQFLKNKIIACLIMALIRYGGGAWSIINPVSFLSLDLTFNDSRILIC